MAKNTMLVRIGETTYERFKRLINSLPEDEHANFTSRIIAEYVERHDLEVRDLLLMVYDDLQETIADVALEDDLHA